MDPIIPISSQLSSVLTWAAAISLAMLALVIFLELVLWRRLFKLVESMKNQKNICPDAREVLDPSTRMFVPFLPGGNRKCILCGTPGLKSPINGNDDEIKSMLCPHCLHEFRIEEDRSVIVNKTKAEVAKSVYGVE